MAEQIKHYDFTKKTVKAKPVLDVDRAHVCYQTTIKGAARNC